MFGSNRCPQWPFEETAKEILHLEDKGLLDLAASQVILMKVTSKDNETSYHSADCSEWSAKKNTYPLQVLLGDEIKGECVLETLISNVYAPLQSYLDRLSQTLDFTQEEFSQKKTFQEKAEYCVEAKTLIDILNSNNSPPEATTALEELLGSWRSELRNQTQINPESTRSYLQNCADAILRSYYLLDLKSANLESNNRQAIRTVEAENRARAREALLDLKGAVIFPKSGDFNEFGRGKSALANAAFMIWGRKDEKLMMVPTLVYELLAFEVRDLPLAVISLEETPDFKIFETLNALLQNSGPIEKSHFSHQEREDFKRLLEENFEAAKALEEKD